MTTSALDQASDFSPRLKKLFLTQSTSLSAWIVVMVASLFFFYEFIQMNMFNAISFMLMKSFSINAEQLGRLSSFYLIANVIFLFPAGALLDRCATRKIILISLMICVLGTLGLSLSNSIIMATFFRFLTGIGSAFCFLSVIRLSSRWFPPKKMALVTGVVVTIAMIGGLSAQTPMTLLVESIGWRHALWADAGLGMVIFLIIYLVVQDYPSSHDKKHRIEQNMINDLGYWKSLRLAFLRIQNWLAGIYCCLMNLPLGLLGGLWGILYLVNADGLSKLDASYVTTLLFLGTIIGSPLVGWLSDKIARRCLPMLIGGVISFSLVMILILTPHLTLMPLLILFLLIGMSTSTQIISYPLTAETSPRIVTAMSVSAVNISVQGGIGIFQPFFGYLLDKHAFLRTHHHTTQFVSSDFHWAMFLFPAAFLLAIIISLLLRESHCRLSD